MIESKPAPTTIVAATPARADPFVFGVMAVHRNLPAWRQAHARIRGRPALCRKLVSRLGSNAQPARETLQSQRTFPGRPVDIPYALHDLQCPGKDYAFRPLEPSRQLAGSSQQSPGAKSPNLGGGDFARD